jgi:2-phospho-L-lactate guanylyltransferase
VTASASWDVVVPVREWATAKSRLRRHLSGAQRASLARALARDTVETVLATPQVRRCWVVASLQTCSDVADWGVRTVIVPDSLGLGGALSAGVRAATDPSVGLAILPADLPLLTADALGQALAAVPDSGAAFVRDADGSGTVLLASRQGPLVPAFGLDSARRHLASGAIDLTDRSDHRLRRDLDTPAHLDPAAARPGSRVSLWYERNVVPRQRPWAGRAPVAAVWR